MTTRTTTRAALVTGGTSGIGHAAARALADAGYHVIVTGRDAERGARVAKDLGGTFLQADFADLDQVRALADEVKARRERLDVLVNNAGVFLTAKRGTDAGAEATFVINHLAPFVLTRELLPLLERAERRGRVVNVASDMHWRGTLDLDDLAHDEKPWLGGVNAYARSKLANVLFTRELAKRLDPERVTVNAVHPGVVKTRLGRGNRSLVNLGWKLMRAFGKTEEEGADTVVWLATSPDVEGATGKYWGERREKGGSPASRDEALGLRLWAKSEALTGTRYPERR